MLRDFFWFATTEQPISGLYCAVWCHQSAFYELCEIKRCSPVKLFQIPHGVFRFRTRFRTLRNKPSKFRLQLTKQTEEASYPLAMLPSKSRAGVREPTLAEKLVVHHCQNRIALLSSEKRDFEEPNEHSAASLATLRFGLQERALLDIAGTRSTTAHAQRGKQEATELVAQRLH